MMQSQILIHQMSYNLYTGTTLFNELTMTLSKHKTGLVGRNGIGKSTLIKLILGELIPHAGSVHIEGTLAYAPQSISISAETTITGFLGYEDKIKALHRITQGSIDEHDFTLLNEDWDVEERMQKQLGLFGLDAIPYHRHLNMLSGGETTRLLLVKAFSSNADFLLLDEPTNHLDLTARQQLYQAIKQRHGGLIVVSHDRTLLNLMDEIIEVTSLGANCYGGNYDDYAEQKEIENTAHEQQLNDAKKLILKNKNSIQLSREKHEKKQAYGRELRRRGSSDKMGANSKKGRSERTQSTLLIREERMLDKAEMQLKSAREKIEINETINVDLPETRVPNGKVILDIEGLNFSYSNDGNKLIHNYYLKIQGPDRVALAGDNGSGKSTLIKLILNGLQPQSGKIFIGTQYISYLDQNASALNRDLTVLENFLILNPDVKENDAYRCLAQFLFRNVTTKKLVKELSGGEKLRALLACVLMSKQPPQLLILDEPTNHLDLHSIASIESALKNYQGAMIVISHDQRFLENIGISRIIHAPFN